MKQLAQIVGWFWRDEDGQDVLEYALLATLIACAAVGAVTVLGDHINRFFWQAIGPSI
jgi:Flp pilus assembly pilin Flp